MLKNLVRHALGQINCTEILIDFDTANVLTFYTGLVSQCPDYVARFDAMDFANLNTVTLCSDFVMGSLAAMARFPPNAGIFSTRTGIILACGSFPGALGSILRATFERMVGAVLGAAVGAFAGALVGSFVATCRPVLTVGEGFKLWKQWSFLLRLPDQCSGNLTDVGFGVVG